MIDISEVRDHLKAIGFYPSKADLQQLEIASDEHPDEVTLDYLPPFEDFNTWMLDSICPTPDGCEVEPDGECEHGCPSWLRLAGVI